MKDYRNLFERQIAKHEEIYRHAVAVHDTRRENPYWPVLAKRIVQELHEWAVTYNAARRLGFDPKRLNFIHQQMDYGCQSGVGMQTKFLPMPKSKWQWESYELFLVVQLDEARRERDEANADQKALYAHWIVRLLVRQCSVCGWVLRWHRCRSKRFNE